MTSSLAIGSSSSPTMAAIPIAVKNSHGKEVVLNGTDRWGREACLKIFQEQEIIYVFNPETGELKSSFYTNEISFDEVVKMYVEGVGMKVAVPARQQETTSTLHKNAAVVSKVGCTTLCAVKSDSSSCGDITSCSSLTSTVTGSNTSSLAISSVPISTADTFPFESHNVTKKVVLQGTGGSKTGSIEIFEEQGSIYARIHKTGKIISRHDVNRISFDQVVDGYIRSGKNSGLTVKMVTSETSSSSSSVTSRSVSSVPTTPSANTQSETSTSSSSITSCSVSSSPTTSLANTQSETSSSSSSVTSHSVSSVPTAFAANIKIDKEITINGKNKLGEACQKKIVQDKENIYIIDGITGEIKESLSAAEFSFEEVVDMCLQPLGSKIAAFVPQVEKSVSKMDRTLAITQELGCVTLIAGKNNSNFGHAQLVFEAIQDKYHAVWLTDICLPPNANMNSCSLPNPAAVTFANIRVINLTGKELTATSQTDTWLLATEKIQAKIQELMKKAEAHERVLFFRTGKGSRGVPSGGNNCLTWAEGVLESVGIELYKDVCNYRSSLLASWAMAPIYVAPSDIIKNDSLYCKRRVLVRISLAEDSSNFPKADVTKKIHEYVLSMTKGADWIQGTFWQSRETIYQADAQKDSKGEYHCSKPVKIPIRVRIIANIKASIEDYEERTLTEEEVDVTEEVDRQLNISPSGDGVYWGMRGSERSAFEASFAKRDLAIEQRAASYSWRFWNGASVGQTLKDAWSFLKWI